VTQRQAGKSCWWWWWCDEEDDLKFRSGGKGSYKQAFLWRSLSLWRLTRKLSLSRNEIWQNEGFVTEEEELHMSRSMLKKPTAAAAAMCVELAAGIKYASINGGSHI